MAHRRGLGIVPSMLRMELRTLKRRFNVGREIGMVASNPFERVPLPKIEPKFLTEDQVGKLHLAAQETEGNSTSRSEPQVPLYPLSRFRPIPACASVTCPM